MVDISESSKKMSKIPLPIHLVNMEVALGDFYIELQDMVIRNAKKKGYHGEGDNGRILYDFVAEYAHGHSIGEIIYKAIRWTRKKDTTDLVKIAAWAFLIWDNTRRYNSSGVAEAPESFDKETRIKEDINSYVSEGLPHAGNTSCANCGFVYSAHKHSENDRCPMQPAGRNNFFQRNRV